jgi:hypothetical protein
MKNILASGLILIPVAQFAYINYKSCQDIRKSNERLAERRALFLSRDRKKTA